MKITKRQLRRIIREYEVPHESRTFPEDHPDFQRGQDDAMMGYPAMDGATPEYMEGYYDGSELVPPRRLGENFGSTTHGFDTGNFEEAVYVAFDKYIKAGNNADDAADLVLQDVKTILGY